MARISRFHELMKALPRHAFEGIVADHQADKHSKGFSCWLQLTAMLYGHLANASSLRVLEAGFNKRPRHPGQSAHLASATVRRSTLADANSKRNPEVFAATARLLMTQTERSVRRDSKELLYLLDSTSFTLKGRGFDDWTRDTRNARTQGIKLHILLNASHRTPRVQSFTPPNVNDRDEAVKLTLEPGAIYVFDKGYCDYSWWQRIDALRARFITRFKRNASLRVEEVLAIPAEDADCILGDAIVCLANRNPGGGRRNPYTQPLRRVIVARPNHEGPLVLATNDLESPAAAIAAHYKARWGIELFFKWIKQHLRIRQFLGRSETAVRIQILTALIAYLLLVIYHNTLGYKGSLWIFLAELRATLFEKAQNHRKRRRPSTDPLGGGGEGDV